MISMITFRGRPIKIDRNLSPKYEASITREAKQAVSRILSGWTEEEMAEMRRINLITKEETKRQHERSRKRSRNYKRRNRNPRAAVQTNGVSGSRVLAAVR